MFDDTSGYYDAASGVSASSLNHLAMFKLTLIQWWSYWGELVDGLFSWESAWPAVGDTDLTSIGSLSLDMPVMNASVANKKGYMMGMSISEDWISSMRLTSKSFEQPAIQGLGTLPVAKIL